MYPLTQLDKCLEFLRSVENGHRVRVTVTGANKQLYKDRIGDTLHKRYIFISYVFFFCFGKVLIVAKVIFLFVQELNGSIAIALLTLK